MVSPNRLRTKRAAFTVVELIVAMGVLALMMYVVYDMFIGGVRAFKKEEGKTESLESALLAYEMISNDLRRSLYYGVQARDIGEVLPVGISQPGPLSGEALSIMTCAGLDYDANQLPTALREMIDYRLVDSGSSDYKYLSRDGNVHEAIKLTKMNFNYKQAQREDGTPITFINLQLWGYGQREGDHSYLSGLIALDSYSLRWIHPYWGQNGKSINGGVN